MYAGVVVVAGPEAHSARLHILDACFFGWMVGWLRGKAGGWALGQSGINLVWRLKADVDCLLQRRVAVTKAHHKAWLHD